MKVEPGKILLSFDVEEFDLPCEYGVSVGEDELYNISIKGTETILKLVDALNIRVTFFVTGNFASRAPKLIKRMAARHEIASHGMDHSSFKIADLKLSRQLLQQQSDQEITGFRMARLAEVDPAEILNAGYLYESSINPTYLPGRYNNLRLPVTPYRVGNGLLQMPISVTPLCRFPLFWLSFKNLPPKLYRRLAEWSIKKTGFFNLYTHPWEYNDQAAAPCWKIPGYVVRHAGENQTARLAELIRNWQGRYEFVSFSDYINQQKLLKK